MGINNKNIGIITQVRMTSSRLPGKVMKEINHKPLLQYHVERLLQSGKEIIIATTTNQTDDGISDFAQMQNIKVYRGSENNVLSRYYEAALKHNIGIIVRVTSDCPLIDPTIINNGLDKYLQLDKPNLYLSNTIERTYSRGFDFEVFTFDLLKEAFLNANEEADLEHVTPYIWKNKSGKTEVQQIKQPINNSRFRVTVDTQEDFDLVKKLIEKYNADQLEYSSIEKILIEHPELVELNSHIGQKEI